MSLRALRPGVTVGRLRVHGGKEPLATRLAAGRVLSGAELIPQELSPAAVLVVRRLADPWPGQLNLRSLRTDPCWERRVRLALDDYAAQAARPWEAVVPAGADAVLFADRAELLACLLNDARRGHLGERWWWWALELVHADAVETALSASPELVPVVFSRLAERHLMAPAAAWLPRLAALALVARVSAAYGVSAAGEALSASAKVSATYGLPAAGEALASAPANSEDAHKAANSSRMPPPWARWIPAEATQLAGLAVEQQALAGLAILLHHEPLALRRTALVARLARWRSLLLEAHALETPDTHLARSIRGHLVVSRPGSPTDRPIRRPLINKRAAPGGVDAPKARLGVESIMGSAAGVGGPPNVSEDAAAVAPTLADQGHWNGDDPDRVPDVEADQVMAREVATKLGGLFHLVYLAQRLGLYADFTAPARRGIALGVWDFVTLVGHRLLRRADQPRDPVWRLLADLQGLRYEAQAGLGFRPPRVWRARPHWLEPFPPEGPWRYGISDGRLVLRHPGNFVVVDGPADLKRELRRYQIARVVPDHVEPLDLVLTARDRWVVHMSGYLRCRLAAALGVTPAQASRLVFCRMAKVWVTASRIDVVSDLADLPIEVRLAAVDRDPGFVPAAGRSLYFHFR